MTGQSISADGPAIHSDVLDHAREFVALVCRHAPGAYEELLAVPRFRALLQQENSFNHGKLYAWAEFSVFRQEFYERFPDASDTACINAFSRLFLKNDISITNLSDLIEGPGDRERVALTRFITGDGNGGSS